MSGIAGFELTLQPIATSSPCRVTRAWHLLYINHRQLHRARRTRWDRRVDLADASDAFLARDILPVKKRLAVEVDSWADDAPHLRGTGRSKTRRTRGSGVCAGTKTKLLTSR